MRFACNVGGLRSNHDIVAVGTGAGIQRLRTWKGNMKYTSVYLKNGRHVGTIRQMEYDVLFSPLKGVNLYGGPLFYPAFYPSIAACMAALESM